MTDQEPVDITDQSTQAYNPFGTARPPAVFGHSIVEGLAHGGEYRSHDMLFLANGVTLETNGRALSDGSWFETQHWIPPRPFRPGERRGDQPDCRVYWGSHGCCLPRGHQGPWWKRLLGLGQRHMCECAWDDNNELEPREDEDGCLNVGGPPYYGWRRTWFWGEDAPLIHRLRYRVRGFRQKLRTGRQLRRAGY